MHQLTFIYNQNFTGLRYTTTNNSESIDGYSIGNLQIHYQYEKKKLKHNHNENLRYDIYASLNNIWNVNYEVIRFRPMPRRNFQIGISIFFNKK